MSNDRVLILKQRVKELEEDLGDLNKEISGLKENILKIKFNLYFVAGLMVGDFIGLKEVIENVF